MKFFIIAQATDALEKMKITFKCGKQNWEFPRLKVLLGRGGRRELHGSSSRSYR